MKNFKIYKSALAILTSASILLLSGCGSSSSNSETKEKKTTSCRHLTVYFEDMPITFKECEGYDISVEREDYSSEIQYKIKKDNETVFNGITTNYNSYSVYHNVADETIKNESIQKVK